MPRVRLAAASRAGRLAGGRLRLPGPGRAGRRSAPPARCGRVPAAPEQPHHSRAQTSAGEGTVAGPAGARRWHEVREMHHRPDRGPSLSAPASPTSARYSWTGRESFVSCRPGPVIAACCPSRTGHSPSRSSRMNLTPVIDCCGSGSGSTPSPSASATVTASRRGAHAHGWDCGRRRPTPRLLADAGQEFQHVRRTLVGTGNLVFPRRRGLRLPRGPVAEAVRAAAGQEFRTLSVPCSTGEEPYSHGHRAARAGSSASRLGDRCHRHQPTAPRTSAARRFGPEFSFRQTRPAGCGSGIFTSGRAVGTGVRVRVHGATSARATCSTGFLPGERPFDLIFCRNLFIYLHRTRGGGCWTTSNACSQPDGWLCMGHAEPIHLLDPPLSAGRSRRNISCSPDRPRPE